MIRRYRVVRAVSVLLVIATVGVARARARSEAPAYAEVTDLGQIIVTATRREQSAYDAPNAVSVVSRTDIDRRMPFHLIDALHDEVGVFTQRTTNGHGSPVLRGFTGYHTLLLIDGVRLNNWTFRSGPNQYFNTIGVDSVDRIEIMPGPASVLYGNSSLGGVIHARSRKLTPPGTGLSVQPRVYGRWGSVAGDASAGVDLRGGSGNVAFQAGVSRAETGDVHPGKGLDVHVAGRKFFITGEDKRGRIPDTFSSNGIEYERTRLYDVERPTHTTESAGHAALSWSLDDRRTVQIRYQGVQQFVSSRWDKIASREEFALLQFDPQERHLVYANYRAKQAIRGVDSLSLTVSFQRQIEGQSRRPVGPVPETHLTQVRDSVNTIGVSVTATAPPTHGNRLMYGVNAYFDTVDSEQTSPTVRAWGRYPDGARAWDVNAFLQDELQLGAKWTATAGINSTLYRVEADLSLEDPAFGELRKDGTAVTGTAALAFEPTDGLRFHAAAGTGFRAANLDDLSGVQVTNQGIQAPSPDVDAERSVNFELGVKVRRERVGGSATVFATRLDNQMVQRRVSEVYGEQRPVFIRGIEERHPDLDVTVLDNLDESVMRGLEASVYVTPGHAWTIYGVGSILRGEVLKIAGEAPDPSKPWEARVRREPPPHATVGLRWDPNAKPFWGEMFVRGAKKQDRLSKGDIRDPRIPGFTRAVEDVQFSEDGRAIDAGTPGWYTLNVRGGVTLFETARIVVSLENALDRRYREHGSGVNAPGRNVVISLENTF